MRALLRYAFLKSSRDQSLLALTIAPAVMLTAPVLGIAVAQMLRGVGRYPVSVDMRTTPQATAGGMMGVAAVASIVIAAIAGFWLFRIEIGNHSIATMVMATRARAISAVATLHAAVIGSGGFLLSLAITALFTAHVPASAPRMLLLMVCATVAAGASGILMATISAETPMLVPAIAASVMIAFFVLQAGAPRVIAGSAITSVLFVLTAAVLMERRCAA